MFNSVSKRAISSSLMAAVFAASMASMFLGSEPTTALAQNGSPEFGFLVAAGFLCESGSCPAGAKSVNGDSYEITGAGTFNPQTKSVSAAGTFAHRALNGTVLETGVWTSNQLVRFDVYGAAPNGLRQRGIAAGVPSFRQNPMPMSVSPVPVGGLAVFHIRMMPASGVPTNAVLEANCALADAPRERSADGIRLRVERSANEFSEELGGSVMFLAMPARPSAAGKGKQQGTAGVDAAKTPNGQ